MNILNKLTRNGVIRINSPGICSSVQRNASIKIKEDNPRDIVSSRSDPKEQRLYVWGLAELGALGEIKIRSQKNKQKFTHRPIRKIFAFSHRIIDFSCGYGFTLYAVKSDTAKQLYGSGLNTDSQVGYHAVRKDQPLKMVFSIQPIRVPLKNPRSTNIIKVGAGRAHSIALTDKEGVFSLGNNAFGQCGRPVVEDEDYSMFRDTHKIKELDNLSIVDVVCGQDHTLFLTENGEVYSCGCGSDGQTGLGNLKCTNTPTLVEGDIKGENIVKLSSSADSVLALNDKGDVFGWGNSEYFQIPNDTESQQIATPMHIKKLSKLGKIIDIASGSTFSLVLTEKREVFVWGFGILGKGPDLKQSIIPQQIPETLFGLNQFNSDVFVESIHCGINTLAAINNKNELYMWGKNQYGQLGIGHENHQYFPFRVAIGGKVLKVNCGADHTMALCKPFL
ncbi:RCC1-like G exchanging factor-like protein [Planococcus citri]|uniref:RCC1-like G exchanging factor-like protein n=1 Tax=Planococcus citri TaxID=170843 RepID=UPI0031F92F3A